MPKLMWTRKKQLSVFTFSLQTSTVFVFFSQTKKERGNTSQELYKMLLWSLRVQFLRPLPHFCDSPEIPPSPKKNKKNSKIF